MYGPYHDFSPYRRGVLVAVLGLASIYSPAQQSTPSDSNLQPVSRSIGELPLAEVQKLAESGDVPAQNDLALRYSLGAGGAEKDLDKGIGWFRRAAPNGSGKMSTQAGQ